MAVRSLVVQYVVVVRTSISQETIPNDDPPEQFACQGQRAPVEEGDTTKDGD